MYLTLLFFFAAPIMLGRNLVIIVPLGFRQTIRYTESNEALLEAKSTLFYILPAVPPRASEFYTIASLQLS